MALSSEISDLLYLFCNASDKAMGRKRRKVIKVTRRKLPKVFSCPQCGMASIRVLINSEEPSKVVCGSCGLTWEKANVSNKKEAIDLYNEFVDEFMSRRG